MADIARVQPPGVRGRRRNVVLGAAAVGSVGAFALAPIVFEPAAGMPTPSAGQLPFFVALVAAEAAVLGMAVAFGLLGRGLVGRLFSTRVRVVAVHAAMVWMLGSWWLHDGLHMVNGTNLAGLLVIEYAFHLTLMAAAAAAVVAWAFVTEAAGRRP
jgi:hypothetical protein